MSYNKPARTYAEQLEILRSRGLTIGDPAFALRCLKHCNYYRISAYRFPLTVRGNADRFLPGATFEQMWGLYCFDRRLRHLVTEALKHFEISVRAHWAYVLGHAHGAMAYEDPAVFRDPRRHTSALAKLDEELDRSHEVFVSHFRQKYGMDRPPIWAVCEIMSFGLLSRFYENIRRDHDRKAIARAYDLSPDTLKSLLEHAAYVRNLCAHHSRLWNRRFTITVSLPRHRPADLVSSLNPTETRRLYDTLVLLAHVVDIVEPQSHWARRVFELISNHASPVTAAMGFPSDWEARPIWSGRAADELPDSSPPMRPIA
ncbi:Abi family protein [Candidatus Fermentibacteria bacterium]|nr:Abi family protein [Candidatus Fermentibacteria bacterium]